MISCGCIFMSFRGTYWGCSWTINPVCLQLQWTLFFEAIHERYEETVLKPSSSLPCCLNTPLDNLGPVNSCDLPEFYIFDYSQDYWVLQVWQDLATLWSDLFKKDDAYSSGSLKSKLIILILYSFLQFLAYV